MCNAAAIYAQARERKATEDFKDTVIAWLLSDDTGSSSKQLLRYALGEEPVRANYPSGEPGLYPNFPLDREDLGRCLRLFALCPPEAQERILPVVQQWTAFVAQYHPQAKADLEQALAA